MQMDKSVKAIAKRNRDKRHNKRWSDTETKQLLEYLLEQEEFEKPTAQIFYRKFLNTSNLEATWDLCRWKTKSLKSTYKKTETWRSSNAYEANDPYVQDKLRKMCRFYDDLHCLFGQKLQIFANETFDVNTSSKIPLVTAMDENIEEYFITAIKSEENEDHSGLIVPERAATTSPESSFPTNVSVEERNFSQRELIEQDCITNVPQTDQALSLNESENSSFLKMRFEFEKEKFRKEFKLKEKRFAEEIRERKENFELKKLEIEKYECLRILELEKQERIERFKIEMRYRSKEK
ncbi:uncharacterized protein LOC111688209 isoform X1 [Lucilia cuprina]|uniref:uncharacterized protein LOC111688209 isoform X1 n=1 Tax=Lucilia cuprina TaxID=7375 RepID=UPI001F05F78A|nr:uncharacterized protein LOC111688209 isoform X1 [Lucilia cuprina]XP_046804536.1 uncharacterized protein LOC111688209 isoform X1 [Lucilia cuprina]XP_046804537.1 uncharacterized protein LOC111688209 isoform X1 [Lucilia cuprina]